MSKSAKDLLPSSDFPSRRPPGIQARRVEKSQKTLQPLTKTGGKKTTTSKKRKRVTARNRTVQPTEETKNISKTRTMSPDPSTVEPRMVKNLPKKEKRKSSKDSKPIPFAGGSARTTVRRNVPTVVTGNQILRTTRASLISQPLTHKKITLG